MYKFILSSNSKKKEIRTLSKKRERERQLGRSWAKRHGPINFPVSIGNGQIQSLQDPTESENALFADASSCRDSHSLDGVCYDDESVRWSAPPVGSMAKRKPFVFSFRSVCLPFACSSVSRRKDSKYLLTAYLSRKIMSRYLYADESVVVFIRTFPQWFSFDLFSFRAIPSKDSFFRIAIRIFISSLSGRNRLDKIMQRKNKKFKKIVHFHYSFRVSLLNDLGDERERSRNKITFFFYSYFIFQLVSFLKTI